VKRQRTSAVPAESDDESDVPLAKKAGPIRATAHQIGEESDDDVPLGQKLQKEKAEIQKAAAKEAPAARRASKSADTKRKSVKKESDSEDDDKPLSKTKKAAPKKQANGAKKVKKEESDEDAPLKKKKAPAVKKVKAEPAAKKGKGKAKEEDQEEGEEGEEEYRWWEDPTKGDGTTKWTTLEHNGVVFPSRVRTIAAKCHDDLRRRACQNGSSSRRDRTRFWRHA
jgi:DNA topoisomerase-1